jgi:DNA-binding MurR/RpiR family transcriptional regulator
MRVGSLCKVINNAYYIWDSGHTLEEGTLVVVLTHYGATPLYVIVFNIADGRRYHLSKSELEVICE